MVSMEKEANMFDDHGQETKMFSEHGQEARMLSGWVSMHRRQGCLVSIVKIQRYFLSFD